jgi:hypothetical protein
LIPGFQRKLGGFGSGWDDDDACKLAVEAEIKRFVI